MTAGGAIVRVRHGRDARVGATLGALCARAAVVGLSAVALAACADKGFTPPAQRFSPKLSLQISTFASQQIGFGPKYVLVAALYQVARQGSGGDEFVPLAFKFVPVGSGQLQVTLPVDISRCLADATRLGAKDGCSMFVGAVLMPDTVALADTSNADPLSNAFDYAFPIGPFVVGTGKAPTIPPIDLSSSRFGVVRWEGDEALRLGGPNGVFGPTGPVAGLPTAGGGVTLFVPTAGFAAPGPANQSPQGPYPALAAFDGSTWRRYVATSAPFDSVGFRAVAPFAKNDVFAAGQSGLYRFDGSAFTRVSAIGDALFSVAGVTSGTTKLVIAGGNGAVWIGNTQTWTRYALNPAQRIDGVCVTGPNEAFASSSVGGGLWRFDGNAWTFVPSTFTSGKFALQCPAPGQAFVLAIGVNGALLRWGATGWATLPTQGLNAGRLITWGVVSPTEMYAWADSALIDRAFYRFNGSTWTEVGRTRFTQGGRLLGGVMWADPRGGAAYVASPFSRIERVTPGGVTVLSYQPALRDVVVTSPSSAFAVGWNLFLARWDGAKWNVEQPPASTSTSTLLSVRILNGVWSNGPANAWAVGYVNAILRYDGSSWSAVSDQQRPVATPDTYNAVWGSGSTVWIVGENTILKCVAPAVCTNESSGGSGALYGIWGTPDAATKIAVGAGGRIIRSVGGAAWQPMASPTNRTLARVSGSGPNDVWAVGDSVLLHYDGTQWTNVPMTGELHFLQSAVPSRLQALFQLGLWARSPTEVYLGGDHGQLARWDGTAWRATDLVRQYGRRILGISGASGGCALAVTEGQSDQPSPTLWRGIGPSGCFLAPMTPPTSWR